MAPEHEGECDAGDGEVGGVPAGPDRQCESEPAPVEVTGGVEEGVWMAMKTARLAMTPTTAAVMPVSAAVRCWLWWSPDIAVDPNSGTLYAVHDRRQCMTRDCFVTSRQ